MRAAHWPGIVRVEISPQPPLLGANYDRRNSAEWSERGTCNSVRAVKQISESLVVAGHAACTTVFLFRS